MRIWDCHSHCLGDETGESVLKNMDAGGVERINLFTKCPWKDRSGAIGTRENIRAHIDHIAKVQAADPSRIFGLVWADPCVEGMVEEIERAINDKHLRGVKLIPNHWYACDEMLFPLYRKMEELGRPVMFHAGINYSLNDSSRFCQPVYYEALKNFPKMRFSLAHVAWPWVDECLAVFGSVRDAAGDRGEEPSMYIDTCPGTPAPWRLDALRKAVPFAGMDHIMFGIDGWPYLLPKSAPQHIQRDIGLLRDVIGVTPGQLETFFWGACERFMK